MLHVDVWISCFLCFNSKNKLCADVEKVQLPVRACVENGPERVNWLIAGHGHSGQVIIELSSRRTR